MAISEKIGRRIRNIRVVKRISQGELAKTLGKTHATISDIERGQTKLSVEDLTKIAKFFNVTTSEILGEIPKQPTLPYVQHRDAKDITPEERQAADKVTEEFIKLARQLAEQKK